MLIYFNGLLLGLSLIMALGPQNLFLIKQGVRRNHAILSALVCFICDVILVCASVTGLHHMLLNHPTLRIGMMGLGSAFLIYYALKTFKSAWTHNKVDSIPQAHNKMQIILFALGFSLLNPHAIIDSLVIIGSGSSQYPDHQLSFIAGVITASLIWFICLTCTTRYFSNILSKAFMWQTIELCSGFLMIVIGFKLAIGGLAVGF